MIVDWNRSPIQTLIWKKCGPAVMVTNSFEAVNFVDPRPTTFAVMVSSDSARPRSLAMDLSTHVRLEPESARVLVRMFRPLAWRRIGTSGNASSLCAKWSTSFGCGSTELI